MSMNMLPMRFEHELDPPTGLRELVARVKASRRTRYVIVGVVAAFFVLIYLVSAGPGGYPKAPPKPWPMEDADRSSGKNPSGGAQSHRAERVKSMFVRGYTAYEKHAFPHDELLPLSNGHLDKFNGWAVSLVDSLDTMLLMGLNDTVERATAHIAKLTFDEDQNVQFFETIIRYLGGFLSAYTLTGNALYLMRADDVARRLLPAFDTPQGFPSFKVNVRTGQTVNGWAGNNAILSEFASCQMEYRYLAHLTSRPEYVRIADRITDHLNKTSKGGLFSLSYDLNTGEPNGDLYSAGARADSTYEYLLKLWLMTGKTEPQFLDMYLQSADAIITHLLFLSPKRNLLYATDIWAATYEPVGNFQHLTCFLAGLFALGAATIPDVDPRHAWAAEGLAHSCWVSYADSRTGLGPEVMRFSAEHAGRRWAEEVALWERAGRPGGVPPGVRTAVPVQPGEDTEYAVADAQYILRPETVESFYILWRTTGDAKWRERGWAVFEAIETHAATESAYATVLNVNKVPAPKKDEMPSFFFAETLKYLYLLFRDDDPWPLDKWTFNTEAHPFPVFTWSEWEKEIFSLQTQ